MNMIKKQSNASLQLPQLDLSATNLVYLWFFKIQFLNCGKDMHFTPGEQGPLYQLSKAHESSQTEPASLGPVQIFIRSSATVVCLSLWCLCGTLILVLSLGLFSSSWFALSNFNMLIFVLSYCIFSGCFVVIS